MKTKQIRLALLSRAAVLALGAGGGLAWHSGAHAESVCTSSAIETEFMISCADPDSPTEETAHVAVSLGSTFSIVSPNAVIDVYNNNVDATITIEGSEVTAEARSVATVRSIGGNVTYSSSITTTTDGGFNTVLVGDTVTATLASTIVDGSRGYGLYSIAEDGDNLITAGSTTLTAPLSIGLVAYATNGDVVLNTGTVNAAAEGSWGVYSETLTGSACGSNTINVTGNIVSSNWGVKANSCGTGTVHVLAGSTMTRTPGWGTATIYNHSDVLANTLIDGTMTALSSGDLVLDLWGPSTTTLISGTGFLRGAVWTSKWDDAFALDNGAEWETSGVSWFDEGNDVLQNAGNIRASGETTFEGLELLTNSGEIDLAQGVAGDLFTISGDYVGVGGVLLVDVGDTAADHVVITGAASGSTTINANYIGTGTINSTGIQFVQWGSATPGAFKLGSVSGNTSALITYSLREEGGNFFLLATPNALAFQPVLVGSISRDMWHQSTGAYARHTFLRRSKLDTDTKRIGVWGQMHGSMGSFGSSGLQTVFGTGVDFGSRVRTDQRGAQLGTDFLAGNNFLVGVTGGYGRATTDQVSQSGRVEAKGYNIGLYGQLGANAGFYARALLKKDWQAVKLTNSAFDQSNGDPDATSTGVDLEGGYRWHRGSMRFEAGAGVAYVRTRIDGFAADGIAYEYDLAQSVRGRLGAQIGFRGKLAPFVAAKLDHELGGNNKLTLSSGAEEDSVEAKGRGTWGRLEAGIGGQSESSVMLSGWVDVGDSRGAGLNAGLRF